MTDTEPHSCFICAKPFKAGEMVLPSEDGLGHRVCFGEDREGYVKDLGSLDPLEPDETIPAGEPYGPADYAEPSRTAALVPAEQEGESDTPSRLPERCPHCDLNWSYNPHVLIVGSDQVRCIGCKTLYAAPTPGGDNRVAGYVSQTTLGYLKLNTPSIACKVYGAPVSIHTIALVPLSFLEAVERERDALRHDAGELVVAQYATSAAEASLAAALEDIAAMAERRASEWKRQAGKLALREFAQEVRALAVSNPK